MKLRGTFVTQELGGRIGERIRAPGQDEAEALEGFST